MKVLLLTTVLFSGLVAGLMYAYSCSVSIGLKMLPAVAYINAMQSINKAIQNPLFFLAFMGLLLLFPLTAFQLHAMRPPFFYLFITAMVIYFIAVFGITLFFNVPLNEQLAKFQVAGAGENEIAAMRSSFEKPWNTFHTIRTIAAILSFALTILFIIKQKF